MLHSTSSKCVFLKKGRNDKIFDGKRESKRVFFCSVAKEERKKEIRGQQCVRVAVDGRTDGWEAQGAIVCQLTSLFGKSSTSSE